MGIDTPRPAVSAWDLASDHARTFDALKVARPQPVGSRRTVPVAFTAQTVSPAMALSFGALMPLSHVLRGVNRNA